MSDEAEKKAAEKKAKRARTRARLAGEILATEKAYCQDLSDLDVKIVSALRELSKKKGAFLKAEQVAILFGSWTSICGLNQTLCDDLGVIADYDAETTKIGPVFKKFCPFLQMYKSYVSQHEVATTLLTELQAKNEKFVEWMNNALSSMRLPLLESYLIMPAQRVPRYRMLLEEYIKHTEEGHCDLADLKSALEKVSEVAAKVNEEIRSRENRDKIIAVQEQFTTKVSLVKPSRRFVQQDELTKICRKAEKKYEFFLFNDLLLYGSRSISGYKLHKELPIDKGFRIEDIADKDAANPNTILIQSQKKSFYVYAESAELKKKWVDAFKEVLAEYFRSTGKKAEVGHAPVWKHDKSVKRCPICPPPGVLFTFKTRKHHCRKCGTVVCSDCSKTRAVLPWLHLTKPQRICDRCVREGLQKKTTKTTTADLTMEDLEKLEMLTRGEASKRRNTLARDEEKDSDDSSSDSELDSSGSPFSQCSRAKVIYSFEAQGEGDLALTEGDLVVITEKLEENGWWRGTCQGREGIFPSNYVEVLPDKPVKPKKPKPPPPSNSTNSTMVTSGHKSHADLVGGDDIIKKGWLQKRSDWKKKWQARFFVVRSSSNLISYFEDAQMMVAIKDFDLMRMKGAFSVQSTKQTDVQNQFVLELVEKKMYLAAEDEQDREEWIKLFWTKFGAIKKEKARFASVKRGTINSGTLKSNKKKGKTRSASNVSQISASGSLPRDSSPASGRRSGRLDDVVSAIATSPAESSPASASPTLSPALSSSSPSSPAAAASDPEPMALDVPAHSPELYVAAYDSEGEGLVFKTGDLIEIIRKDDSGWWWGIHQDTEREGWIDPEFVQLAPSQPATPVASSAISTSKTEPAAVAVTASPTPTTTAVAQPEATSTPTTTTTPKSSGSTSSSGFSKPAKPGGARRGAGRLKPSAANAKSGGFRKVPSAPGRVRVGSRFEGVKGPGSDGPFYSLDDLQSRSVPGIDNSVRELYLSPEDFESVFGIPKAEYEKMPKWKRKPLKQKHGLF